MAVPPPGAGASPRSFITQDALSVDPSLLGLPLAGAWRRAIAMGIDCLLVLILTQATGFLFGVAAAFVLFKASSRKSTSQSGFVRRSVRLSARIAGAVVLFIVAVSSFDTVSDWVTERGEGRSATAAVTIERDGADVEVQSGSAVMTAAEMVAFVRAENSEDARRRGRDVMTRLEGEGLEREDIEEVMTEVAQSTPDKPWLAEAVDSLAAEGEDETPPAPVADADSLLTAYQASLMAGDSTRADSLRGPLAVALASDTLAALNEQVAEYEEDEAELREEIDELEERAEEAEERGFLASVRSLGEDLGLGAGWFGLYFTSCLALWQGRTPGKRLMRIRVIQLNAKPIGWWAAFNRFGGYAAGFATGLLGFFQILWDRNRQAIHDKISETVVIRDP